MRIFIAILLKKPIVEKIIHLQENLKKANIQGVYTKDDMLHITLHYIGQMTKDKVEELLEKMSEIKINQFSIETRSLDLFNKNKNKKIVYLGVQPTQDLIQCHKALLEQLKQFGLSIKSYKFIPHVTLVRKSEVEFEDIARINFDKNSIIVDKIHIMESKRIHDRLVYESLGFVKFL